jgi:hypothetical protein
LAPRLPGSHGIGFQKQNVQKPSTLRALYLHELLTKASSDDEWAGCGDSTVHLLCSMHRGCSQQSPLPGSL